ncbi:hypothetical protein [Marinithermofilum abyssi]|uniref:hypothetical protein n=1 Tax=Marinithermofilum abyssi TaxID=1571185 RepID=UPI00166F50B3|nr:hypothetical protein [Marinithermofilum abyssi]
MEKGVAKQKQVKLGISDGKRVEILSGVKAGDQVIVQPDPELKNGSEVKAP